MTNHTPTPAPFIPSLRASGLDDYTDCNGRGIARTFPDIITAAGFTLRTREETKPIYLPIGTAAHKGAEYSLTEKLSRQVPLFRDVEEVAMCTLREEIAGGVSFDTATKNMGVAERQVRQISSVHYHMLLPEIDPVQVEPSFEAVGQEFTLTGHPDVITLPAIRDFKSGTSGDNYHNQMGAYSLLARSNNLPRPERLIIDHVPRNHPDEPERFEYDVDFCESLAYQTAARITADIRAFMDSADPMLIARNPRSMLCGPKYCTAWNTDFCPITKVRK